MYYDHVAGLEWSYPVTWIAIHRSVVRSVVRSPLPLIGVVVFNFIPSVSPRHKTGQWARRAAHKNIYRGSLKNSAWPDDYDVLQLDQSLIVCTYLVVADCGAAFIGRGDVMMDNRFIVWLFKRSCSIDLSSSLVAVDRFCGRGSSSGTRQRITIHRLYWWRNVFLNVILFSPMKTVYMDLCGGIKHAIITFSLLSGLWSSSGQMDH